MIYRFSYLTNFKECLIDRTEDANFEYYGLICLPCNMSLTHTELYDTSKQMIWFDEKDKPLLTTGTIARITFIEKDGTSNYTDWVIREAETLSSHRHSYQLEELTTILRDIFIENIYFTKGQYLFVSVISRLLALSETDIRITIAMDSYTNYLRENFYCPDLPINSNNLLDAINDLAKYCNARARLKFQLTDRFTIYFSPLSGEHSTSEINFGKITENKTIFKYENIAKNVYSNVQNMVAGERIWWPNDSQGMVFGKPMPDEYNTELTNDNVAVVLPYPIQRAFRLRVTGFGRWVKNSRIPPNPPAFNNEYWFWRVLPDGTLEYMGDLELNYIQRFDRTLYNNSGVDEYTILEYNQWLITPENNTIPYYRTGDNKIYNIRNLKRDRILYYVIQPSSSTETVPPPGTDPYTGVIIRQDLDVIKDCMFSVEYIPYLDGLVKYSNDSDNYNSILYNQNENIVDANKYIDNLDSYITSMKGGTNFISSLFYGNFSEIPKVGTITEYGIINSISITAVSHYYELIFSFSNDYISKTEFLKADDSIRLTQLIENVAYERKTVVNDYIFISTSETKAIDKLNSNNRSRIVNKRIFCDAVDEIGRDQNNMYPNQIHIKTDTLYSGSNNAFGIAENSYIICFKSLNATVMANAIVNNVMLPIPYVVDGVTMLFEYKVKRILDDTNSNFPAINENEYNNFGDEIIVTTIPYYYKDLSETTNINQMITYNGDNKSIVNDYFLENNTIIKKTFRNTPTEPITPVDNLAIYFYTTRKKEYELENYGLSANITGTTFEEITINNKIYIKASIKINQIVDYTTYKYFALKNTSRNQIYFYLDEEINQTNSNILNVYFAFYS